MAFITCLWVMPKCGIYIVFYVLVTSPGCGFRGRGTTLQVFWWSFVQSPESTFRVVIAVPRGFFGVDGIFVECI